MASPSPFSNKSLPSTPKHTNDRPTTETDRRRSRGTEALATNKDKTNHYYHHHYRPYLPPPMPPPMLLLPSTPTPPAVWTGQKPTSVGSVGSTISNSSKATPYAAAQPPSPHNHHHHASPPGSHGNLHQDVVRAHERKLRAIKEAKEHAEKREKQRKLQLEKEKRRKAAERIKPPLPKPVHHHHPRIGAQTKQENKPKE